VLASWCLVALGCAGASEGDASALGVTPLDERPGRALAGAIAPPTVGVRRFAVVGGFEEPAWYVEEATSASPGGGSLIVTRRLLRAGGGLLSTIEQRTLAVDDDGIARIRRLVNYDENVEFTFEPPAPIRPAGSNDEPIVWQGIVEQIEPGTGSVLRTGTGEATTEASRVALVDLLSGERVRTLEVRTDITMRFGAITVRRSVRAWHAKGLGVVTQHEAGSASAIGIKLTNIDRAFRLLPEEEADGLERAVADEP
jgi:hypothetical protein